MRIRPLLSRSRSRRRRARASHRRSRRSRRHRRRHHRSGISHTITPFAHRRSLSRNHPPRPSSTVARIVIAHHESKMTMRAVARMKPESGRASTRPSLSRASSIDRSIASRCLRSRRARRSLPSSLERDNHIASHLIPFHSSHRAGGPSRPVLARIASTAPRGRHSTYTNTTPSIKQKTITTRAKKKYTHIKNRTGGAPPRPRAPPRAPPRRVDRSRANRPRALGRRRLVLATRRESRARRVRSVDASRSMDEGDGGGARMRRARMGRRARTARAMRTRARRKSRCEGIEAREGEEECDRGTRARRVRRSFGDDSRRASTRWNEIK